MSKKSQPAPEVCMPQNDLEAAKLVKLIGDCQRQITAAENAASAKVAEIQQEVDEVTLPFQEQISQHIDELFLYFAARSDDAGMVEGRKTLVFATGEIGEYTSPSSIELKKHVRTEAVIAELERLGLTQFIRFKPELNKEAMLLTEKSMAVAAKVPGVRVVKGSTFFVKPNDGIETASKSSKLRKRIK